MEELAREREERSRQEIADPEAARAIAALRLARIDLERQLAATTHDARLRMLRQALADLDERIAGLVPAGR